VRLCAPGDLVLAYTGVSVGRQDEEANTCTQIESGPVRDFVIAASRDFVVARDTVDGVTVNSYYLPGHESGGSKALEISRDSLKTYDEKFGPYPFTELDVIDAPMRNALGVEYPGIILIAQSLYDDPSRADFDIATAHEVAHQWWYSVIGNDVFEEPWLDEGLTSFSSSLYYEYNLPLDYVQGLWGYWEQRYDQLKSQNHDQPVTESLAYFEEDPSRAYGSVVYTKAALFFHALREEIGDDAFFSALQQYYTAHKYGIARGSDLLDAFEAASGRQLDDFYQEWLFSPR
jgi:aminopeptidase N